PLAGHRLPCTSGERGSRHSAVDEGGGLGCCRCLVADERAELKMATTELVCAPRRPHLRSTYFRLHTIYSKCCVPVVSTRLLPPHVNRESWVEALRRLTGGGLGKHGHGIARIASRPFPLTSPRFFVCLLRRPA
ncbi:unnamed protein product, partial [Laminaria digitata]